MSSPVVFEGINSEIKTPLRIYRNEGLKDKNKKGCDKQCPYKLIAPSNRILPFQFWRPLSSAIINTVELLDVNGVLVQELAGSPGPAWMLITPQSDAVVPVDIITFLGDEDFGLDLPCGFYSLRITDEDELVYYSEDFFVPEDITCNAQLKWSHNCNYLGNLYYGNALQNKFYLEDGVTPMAGAVNVIKEYDENGNKDRILRRIRKETRYSLKVGPVPWFVADALTEMPLHSSVLLVLNNSLGQDTIHEVDVQLEDADDLDDCKQDCIITFMLQEVTVVDGCCDGEVEIPVECAEQICDIDFSQETTILTDWFYTDAQAILDGLSVDSAPTLDVTAEIFGTMVCAHSTPLDTVFFEVPITRAPENPSYFVLTVDSISVGSLKLIVDGIEVDEWNTPGSYEAPAVLGTASVVQLKSGALGFDGCITLGNILHRAPCWEPVGAGKHIIVADEPGIFFVGDSTLNRLYQYIAIPSAMTYAAVELIIGENPAIPLVVDQGFGVYINNELVYSHVYDGSNWPVDDTFTFAFDPQTLAGPLTEFLDVEIRPILGDGTNSLHYISISFCGIPISE
jgi:hypothetical protein